VKMICPYWKNDITTILRSQKPAIYSRYLTIWVFDKSYLLHWNLCIPALNFGQFHHPPQRPYF
jgi:hypothetical protein